MKYLGIRIENGHCKTALLSRKKKGFSIHELTSYPSREAFFERKSDYQLVCGVEEKDVLIKRVNTPNNSHRILKKTLPFQIDTYFEIKQNNFLFHPFTCFTTTTFVAAASKKIIDEIIEKFDPRCITTEQSALLHFAKVYAEEYHSLCIVFAKKEEVTCVTLEKGNYGRSCTFPLTDNAAHQILQLMPAKRKLPLLFLGNSRKRKALKDEFDKHEDTFQVVSLSLPDAQIEYALEIGLALEGLTPQQMSIQFRKGKRAPKEEKKRFKRGLVALSFALLFLAGACHFACEAYYESKAEAINSTIDTLMSQYPDLFKLSPLKKRVDERIGMLKEEQAKVTVSKRYIEPSNGFSGIYALVSTTAKQHGLFFRKIEYQLKTYPTIKNPKEKYRGELHIHIASDDAIKIKEFCEALSQKGPFANDKKITILRDTNGFSITCAFIE